MMIIEQILSFIAPHYCSECGREGQLLCAACMQNVFAERYLRCALCESNAANDNLCAQCRLAAPLTYLWVASAHEASVARLVSDLKFNGKRAMAEVLAAQLDALLPYLPPETIVTHLPTAPRRVRQRGYDQAALIARQLARRRGLAHATLLYRRHQGRQLGASRGERLQQAATAYGLHRGLPAASRPILLIDDVLTTGASILAAAELLRAAGHSHLMAAVVAARP